MHSKHSASEDNAEGSDKAQQWKWEGGIMDDFDVINKRLREASKNKKEQKKKRESNRSKQILCR